MFEKWYYSKYLAFWRYWKNCCILWLSELGENANESISVITWCIDLLNYDDQEKGLIIEINLTCFWKKHCFLLVIFIFIKSVYWWRMVEEIHVIRIDFQSQRQGSYSGKNKIIKLSSNGDTLRPLSFFYFHPWETPTQHFVTQVWPSWFQLSPYDRKSSGRYICTEIRELYQYNLTLPTGKTGALVCFCLFVFLNF